MYFLDYGMFEIYPLWAITTIEEGGLGWVGPCRPVRNLPFRLAELLTMRTAPQWRVPMFFMLYVLFWL
jgi:hypothetical protein